MKIAVFGAGAWGTALALAAATRHEVLLWARDPAQAAAMDRARCNARYLPELNWSVPLAVTADAAAARGHARDGLAVIATPMAALREQLGALQDQPRLLWLSKGFESGSGALGHEIARALGRQAPYGVLSGPSFAIEVARGQPAALVAASADPGLVQTAIEAFHGAGLRIYASTDVLGVEVGGAVKNVMAIAAGVLDGLQLGLNARAALVTRGLAEITRLGVAMGARPETFMGLSGLGDLLLTTTGDLSRNRRVGLLLAAGIGLPEALARLGHVAEGVSTAPMVLERAHSLGVEMPITACVVALLEGRIDAASAVALLMTRDARPE